jgi:glycogen synthase
LPKRSSSRASSRSSGGLTPQAVLHLTSEYPPDQFGGLGTGVEGLARASAEAGIRTVVVLVSGSAAYGYGYGYGADKHGDVGLGFSELRPSGVTLFREAFRTASARAIELAATWRPDVIHLHSSWLWPVARAVRDSTGTPIVYTAHSLDRAEVESGEWIAHGPIQDEAIVGSNLVVAVSRSERDRLARFYPAAQERVRAVGNGIRISTHSVRPDRNGHLGTAIVLYVGRFARRKGLIDLFEAVPRVVERVPRALFLLAGGDSPDSRPGSGVSWVPNHVRRHLNRIRFLGWLSRPELDYHYLAADVLVVPSRYEPFGMVVLEGMAYGLPIVAAAVDGPAEILDDGRTALLFPAGDVGALAHALVRVLGDVELRSRLGAAAQEEVRARWGWEQVLPSMLAVYRDL